MVGRTDAAISLSKSARGRTNRGGYAGGTDRRVRRERERLVGRAGGEREGRERGNKTSPRVRKASQLGGARTFKCPLGVMTSAAAIAARSLSSRGLIT